MLDILYRRRDLLICLLLVAITLAVFWQVKDYEFVHLDDNIYLTENPRIQSGLTIESLAWAFTTNLGKLWMPLTWLSFMLDFEVHGLDPGGYHLTNLLFHIVNALLLFMVLNRCTGALWRSALVAALFALHPLRVESVAWVSERKDVLSTFFWMLTMWGYSRYVERPGLGRYLLPLLFFALGLMAKAMLLTLPFVLLLFDYWPLGRVQFGKSFIYDTPSTPKSMIPGEQRLRTLRLVLEKTPFFALAAVSLLVTYLALKDWGTTRLLDSFPLGIRVANALVSYVKYMGMMIWPKDLAALYPHPGGSLPIWQLVGACLLLVAICAVVVRAARQYPYVVVGWLWYLGTLVPVIGLFQAGPQAMADRFTYVPLIGLFIVIAWGVPAAVSPWRHGKVAVCTGAATVLFLLVVCTRVQLQHWKNSLTLFRRALEVTENNYIVHNNFGSILTKRGKIEDATAHFTRALEIKPDYAEAYYNLGSALARQGHSQKAIAQLSKAVAIKPDYWEAHNNLGNLLERQGKLRQAERHFNTALQFKPDVPEVHFNLGNTLARQGKLDEAIVHYLTALRLEPNYPQATNNLGNILLQQGRLGDAIGRYSKAVHLKPDYAEAHNNLGVALFRQGRNEEAIAHILEALRLEPDYAQARANLSIAQQVPDKTTEAPNPTP